MSRRAVVLLSGGLDSSTAAALVKREGYELFALTVRYGQTHVREIEAARRVAEALGAARHIEIDVDLSAFGGSALVGDGEIPKDRAIDASGIPSTYVPARNTVFLALALGWAEVVGAECLVIGVNAFDYSGYPDCRPEYIAAFEYLASLATRAGVEGRPLRIWAPLQDLTKAGVIRLGQELGVDYGLTHSCYDPQGDGGPCGRCDSCQLRAKGFAEAGIADPLLTRVTAPSDDLEPGTRTRNQEPGTVPMTDRLYYNDSYLTAFDAVVRSCDVVDGRTHVVLDRTAFYPSSGGQPFDTGRLGGRTVLDVMEDEAGEVVHVVSGPLNAGAAVRGEIDWPRRLDHMQQHTGQHLLSAAFDRLFGVRTVSFHLGTEASTIDLAREVTATEIDRAEAEANQVVWDNRSVSVRFVSAEEAAQLPLRKEPVRGGTLRLVEIQDFDLSACGGTHVPHAGVVGLIAVAGVERFKGASRLTFVCGVRALRSHGTLRDVVLGATRALSVTPPEVKGAIERLQSEARDATKLVRRLQDDLAVFRAAKLRDEAEAIGPHRGVLRAEADLDGSALKGLAAAVVEGSGLVVVLTGRGTPVPVVVARSADVSIDAAALLREIASELGGRGGGTAALAQGGLTSTTGAIVEAARRRISQLS